ncbi:hypothetical protein RR46_13486 [Papilio xuthus]|uniref:Transmembrane protein INAFM2 n=1 Tax=Papilio xuthus TaxID=66420 RepID=A0A194PMC1_PAPXU|nr:hypothetical protein RR46_13486 [Papilio xuthus]
MSGNGQNEEGAKESSGGGGGGSGGDDGRDMYRPKNVSTVVRVLTVTAYLLSVSMAAILLSVYYVFVWKSPELPVDGARLEARRDHGAYLASLHNHSDDYYDFGYLAVCVRRCQAADTGGVTPAAERPNWDISISAPYLPGLVEGGAA